MNNRDLLRQNESVVNFISRAIDASVVFLSGLGSYFFYFRTFDLTPPYFQALLLASLLTLILFPAFDNYRSWRGRSGFAQFRVTILSLGSVLILLLVLSALLKTTAAYSRIWFSTWSALGLVALFAYRRILILVLRDLRKRGWNRKSIVIYGAGDLGKMVAGRLKTAEWTGFDLAAFFDDNAALEGTTYEGAQIQSGISNLSEFVREHHIQEIWLALPLRAEERVKQVMYELRHSPVMIRFVPDIFSFRLLLGHAVTEVAGIPVVDINYSPISGLNYVIKEIEDRFLGTLILLMISPVLLLISIAIWIDSRGPIVFKQERHGWDGKVIKVYKFRSMVVHQEQDGKVTQATKGDARVTKVGAFIRRTSLDELPQFFNVVQGRMSIVGPRPHPLAHNEFYKEQVDHYFQRLRVKPGITGWAQVNGWRGETDTLDKMKKRVEYDLYYIQNWSLGFDLKIIVLTLFKGFVNENAY
jgi:Undecaprenyl-phosphate glucose phosphotransferase